MQSLRPRAAEIADASTLSPSDPYRAWKQAGLLLLALVWIALGLVGHDPWKFDDATTFGIAWEMNQRGDYVVPRLAGEVYLLHPPLMPVLAAATQRLLSPPLEPFDAARIAAGGVLALILLFTALASGELAGPAFRWLPMLVLIGSVGLWDRAHVLSRRARHDGGGCDRAVRVRARAAQPVSGGAWLGVGAAVAFLSHGFQGPAVARDHRARAAGAGTRHGAAATTR